MPEIKKVGVVGCGLMGHGIAQVAATTGYDVTIREVDEDLCQKGMGMIDKQLDRAVSKGRSSQENAEAIRGRLHNTTEYDALADCDLVVEAITENLDAKLEMWKGLDPIVQAGAIFASTPPWLPITAEPAATNRPEKFVGLHFFTPAQVMKLVEVIRCVTTS